MKYLLFYVCLLAFVFGPVPALDAQVANSTSTNTARLLLQVNDEQGGGIEGAKIVVSGAPETEYPVADMKFGRYEAAGLPPGRYTVRISAQNFASYERTRLDIASKDDKRMTVVLRVMAPAQEIVVYSEPLSTPIPEYLGGVRVIRGAALDNLPQTDDAMMAYLRMLTPLATGPFGPTLIVDGFQAGNLPPKSSIREIRINDNPFSSEFNQVGTNRVEILTKPGTDNWQTGLFINYNDQLLNSRNPFADIRAPYESRIYGGSLSGPLIPRRLTFLLDGQRIQNKDNAIIRATTVDSNFNLVPFNRTVVKPSFQNAMGGSLNLQINTRNTVALRVNGGRKELFDEGIGGFSLQSRAYQSSSRNQIVQLTETAVLGQTVLNEVRAQFSRNRLKNFGDDSIPTINVDQAFVAGGSQIGHALNTEDSWTVANVTSWNHGNHVLKGGWEGTYLKLVNDSATNFGGTYTFTGQVAPALDSHNLLLYGPDGQPVLESISNIESYRRTLYFQNLGLPPAVIRAMGGGASQFTISAGSALAGVRQHQLAVFLHHDWRVTPSLTMSQGIRYEGQYDLTRRSNFAPRLAFAWQPLPKTTIRSGSGIFYDIVSQQVMLQARQFNGVIQSQYQTSDPAILDQFPAKITVNSSSSFSIPQSFWRTSDTLRMPYSIYSSFTIEQQLPKRTTIAATGVYSHGNHVLRSRDVNAPLPDGSRPLPINGEVFQIESSAGSELRQLGLNTSHKFSDRLVLWTTYTLSNNRSESDGPFTLPSYSYDLKRDFGRVAATAKHTLYAGGWIGYKGFELTPMVMWRSGQPFNITTGEDLYGDGQFLARPAFATDLSRPSVVKTAFGTFDLSPGRGQTIIPRNYGTGPGFAVANLKITRIFKLGELNPATYSRKRIVVWSAGITNLFNRTNPGSPVGNLSSPLFGTSTSAAGDFGFGSNTAGNRRIDLSLVFAF